MIIQFNLFNHLLIQPESDLAARVKEAEFFFLFDFFEVKEKLEQYSLEQEPSLTFTLHDAVIISLVMQVMQKICLSKNEYWLPLLFEEAAALTNNEWSAGYLRDRYVTAASRIQNALSSVLQHQEVFTIHSQQVTDFVV